MPNHPHPSDHAVRPADVTDPLLWALAVDVTAAHQPDPDGACGNPQCRGLRGPCHALRAAQRAAALARRPRTDLAPSATAPPAGPAVRALVDQPVPRRHGRTVRARAAVPTAPDRFTGWFTPTRTPPADPTDGRRAPAPTLAA
ncbi:hypothetical protein ACNTMW_18250 [Planosporangium sp. 12N6]|uniref:hypothetical protein n=1 Tax=Planosporangium spinosum TaxID=3402278 RepID=UPI003CEC102A